MSDRTPGHSETTTAKRLLTESFLSTCELWNGVWESFLILRLQKFTEPFVRRRLIAPRGKRWRTLTSTQTNSASISKTGSNEVMSFAFGFSGDDIEDEGFEEQDAALANDLSKTSISGLEEDSHAQTVQPKRHSLQELVSQALASR